jgi:hypothetical protein
VTSSAIITLKLEESSYCCFCAFDGFRVPKLKERIRSRKYSVLFLVASKSGFPASPPRSRCSAARPRRRYLALAGWHDWQNLVKLGPTQPVLAFLILAAPPTSTLVIFPDQRLLNLSLTSDVDTSPHSFAPPARFSSRLNFSLDSAAIVPLLRSWLERSVSAPFSTHQIAHSTLLSTHDQSKTLADA